VEHCTPEYRAALARLFALGQGRMLPGRDRLRSLLERAGNPHLKVPSILVGGTNGKGRLVTTLSAMLSQQYRTGAFVKPHLKSIRERWRLYDLDMTPAQFNHYASAACDLIEEHQATSGEAISFFEANVLLGALYWAGEGAEVVVWEVGLGGREDACNLCDPFMSVITNVQYDHMQILGDTLEKIALDKAGICRPGRPLVLGPARPGWEDDYARYRAVIEAEAAKSGALFIAADDQALLEQAFAGVPLYRSDHFPIPGDTLDCVVACEPLLAEAGFPLEPGQVWDGIYNARYRGRMELTELDGHPALLDAAHNADSLRYLGGLLRDNGIRCPFVFGCQSSREPAEMLEPLKDAIAQLVPICLPVLHPWPVERIVAASQQLGIPVSLPEGFVPAEIPADYEIGHVTECDAPDNVTGWIECVRHGLSLSTEDNPTVICGSIYNLGEILRAFEDGWLVTNKPESDPLS
jgi:dihydrofolate synthase/folylpolyglutamate synthase